MKWNAIYVLSDLTEVDKENKFNSKLLNKYFGLLHDKSMVTAANTFRTLGKVALNKPKFRRQITDALLNVDVLPFSTECKNILAGQAMEAIGLYIDKIKGRKEIVAFIEKNLHNKRSGTRRKAEKFRGIFCK